MIKSEPWGQGRSCEGSGFPGSLLHPELPRESTRETPAGPASRALRGGSPRAPGWGLRGNPCEGSECRSGSSHGSFRCREAARPQGRSRPGQHFWEQKRQQTQAPVTVPSIIPHQQEQRRRKLW